MKLDYLQVFVCLVLSVCLTACHESKVKWADLEKEPSAYEGKKISICGWLRIGLEDCALSRVPLKNYGGRGMIWISPVEGDCASSDDPLEKGAWHLVSGTYRSNANSPASGFGHLDSYNAEISDAKIIPLDNNCQDISLKSEY